MANQFTQRLTQKIVRDAQPRSMRYELWDSDLPGFGVRIEVSGTKSFLVRYRADGGGRNAPRRFMSLGRYGVLTVEEARSAAKKLLGSAAMGADPASDRQARRREMTVQDLYELYQAEGARHLKERTRDYTLARLRHHVLPLLGSKRISDVRVSEVERFIQDVSDRRTARDGKDEEGKRVVVRGGRGAAGKVVRDLSAMYAFAIRRELIAANPCNAAKKPSDGKRDRYLSPPELTRLGQALEELVAEGMNPKASAIVRLLVLTGCRKEEIAALRWSEVDLERSRLVLEETKTGRSIRPLSSAAVQLIAQMQRDLGSPYVFPAERGAGSYQGLKKVWPTIVARAKLTQATPHTLRHTFGSAAASGGETLLTVGALLGHANPRSTSIYAHLQDSSSRSSADRVAAGLAAALSPTASSSS